MICALKTKRLSIKPPTNTAVIAFYCFDPLHYIDTGWGFKKTEAYRAQFLIETLEQLQKILKIITSA